MIFTIIIAFWLLGLFTFATYMTFTATDPTQFNGVAPNFQEIQSANLNTFKLPFKASPIPGFKYYIKAE